MLYRGEQRWKRFSLKPNQTTAGADDQFGLYQPGNLLRELISMPDAIDKLYFRSLTDQNVGLKREDFAIHISVDKQNRVLTISDNGIGMNAEELRAIWNHRQ